MIKINNIYNMDCLEGLKKIKDKSIDLIFTDPPYNIKYKKEKWDYKLDYLEFMKNVFIECERVLKNKGSFYFFHNQFPVMSKLNEIIENNTNFEFSSLITCHKINMFSRNWKYPSRFKKIDLNKFFSTCEYILYYRFKGYKSKSSTIHNNKNCFREIKDYLISEKKKSNLKEKQIREIINSVMGRHYFSNSQFSFIKEEHYKKLSDHTGNFQRDYNEFELREEYEKLKEEYYKQDFSSEFLTTFNKFDLWMENFIETTIISKRIHPCQKHKNVIERIIKISSNEGDVVLDLFSGSGSISKVTKELKRNFIGFEIDTDYYKKSLEFIGT